MMCSEASGTGGGHGGCDVGCGDGIGGSGGRVLVVASGGSSGGDTLC